MSGSDKKLVLPHLPLDGEGHYIMWFQGQSLLVSVGSYGLSPLEYANQRHAEWIALSSDEKQRFYDMTTVAMANYDAVDEAIIAGIKQKGAMVRHRKAGKVGTVLSFSVFLSLSLSDRISEAMSNLTTLS